MQPPKWSFAVVFLLSAGVYINILENDFVYDDSMHVVHNEDIRDLSSGHFFLNDVRGRAKGHPKHTGSWRPLTGLSYALNYSLSGLRPGGFHFIDIVLHGICSVLVFLVCGRFFESWKWAMFAAVVFGLHPVHTEAVCSVTNRSDVLAASFALLSLLSFMRFRERGNNLYLVPLGLCYLAAIWSKESGITLIGLLFLFDWVSRWKANAETPIGWRLYLPYAVVGVTAAVYLVLRHMFVGELTRVPYTDVENPMAFADFRTKWLTRAYLIVEYARLLVFPVHLSADYSFNQISLVAIRDIRNLLTLVVAGLYVAVFYWSLERDRTLFFAMASTAITFSLTANILLPIGTFIGERLLYLPSMGICMAIAWAAQEAFRRWNGGGALKALRAAVVVVCVLFGIRTAVRTSDWKTNQTLFESAERVSPNSVKVIYNLGHVYASKARFADAETKYLRAIQIKPDFVPAWVGLSGVYSYQGRVAELKTLYESCVERRIFDVQIALNYADTLKGAGKWESAAEVFESALSFEPERIPVLVNLGVCYEKMGYTEAAIKNYRSAVALAPDNFTAAYNLSLLLIRELRLEEADKTIESLPEKLKRKEKMLKVRYELIVKLVNDLRDYSSAARHIEYILKRDPDFPNADVLKSDLIRWRKEGH